MKVTIYFAIATVLTTGALYAEGEYEIESSEAIFGSYSEHGRDLEADYMPLWLTGDWKHISLSQEWNTYIVRGYDGLLALKSGIEGLYPIDTLLNEALALQPDSLATWDLITDDLRTNLILREYPNIKPEKRHVLRSYESFKSDLPELYREYPERLERAAISAAWFAQVGRNICGALDPEDCFDFFSTFFQSRYLQSRYWHPHTDHSHGGGRATHSHEHSHSMPDHHHTHKH